MSRKRKPIKWTEEVIALLGVIPDTEIAKQLGISAITVGRKRRELNIPSYSWGGRKPRKWTKKMIALLGTMPDSEVAKRLGISLTTIYWKRSELNIPAYSEDESY